MRVPPCRSELVRRIAADQAAALGGLVPPVLRATYADKLVALHGVGYLSMTAIYRQIVNDLALDDGHRRLHPRRLTTDFERRLAALQTSPHAPVAVGGNACASFRSVSVPAGID